MTTITPWVDRLTDKSSGQAQVDAMQAELAELRAFKERVESQTMEWHLDGEAAGFLAGFINAGDEPTSVNLKLGHIKDDDGKVSYGLLVLDAEYPEEGASLLVECAPPSPVNAELVEALEGLLKNPNSNLYHNIARTALSNAQAAKPALTQEQVKKVRDALENLHALVWGECPSLLNEDSGGNSALDMDCLEAIEIMKGAL